MIKKLRYQFVFITMACISFLFVLILGVINISMTLSSRGQGYALLYRQAEFQQTMEEKTEKDFSVSRKEEHPGKPGDGFDMFRSFSVLYDAEGKITDLSFQENSIFTEEEIRKLAAQVIDEPKERGVISKYLYITKAEKAGTRIYFLDYSMEKSMSLRLFWICLLIGLAGILFLFIVVFFLSRFIVLPVQTAFEKQKQFIADASHELKTPLTIITTNAEVLAGSIGENKWLNHILGQTKRMRVLIEDLLELAKLDTVEKISEFTEFDMSTTVKNAALSFESMAYEYGKKYEMNITDSIALTGNENSIRQLTTILLDNAFKYSEENGHILITLAQHGDKKVLSVENTGKGISKEDQSRIFERFYRSDASRSRESGGYGLGLSIAESIVQAHKGHIQVKSDEQSLTKFIVTLT